MLKKLFHIKTISEGVNHKKLLIIITLNKKIKEYNLFKKIEISKN